MSIQLAGSPHGTDYWDHKEMGHMDPEVVLELKKSKTPIIFCHASYVPTHYTI
jgi:hypothetical protein